MNHSFNIDVATEYGIGEAIFLENMVFWIRKNAANNVNFNDGKFWTYNSQEALARLFPYWTRRQVQRIISNLESQELIIKGNYNKLKYDRTTWYSLTKKAETLYNITIAPKGSIENTKRCNRIDQNVQPIPDINTDIKSDTKRLRVKDTEADLSKRIFEYYNTLNLVKHKSLTKNIKDSIKKAKRELSLDEKEMKRMLDRYAKDYHKKLNTDYPLKKRTLSEFFGQKKYKGVDLICYDYSDEVYQESKEMSGAELLNMKRPDF